MVWPRGALAVVVLAACSGRAPKPTPPAEPPKPRDPLAAGAIMRDVTWLCDPARQGRGSYQQGGREAADYMARELAAAGLEVERQPVGEGADNILAIARGDAEAIVVSAHYDHLGVDSHGTIYPGADDNASGAAVLLAIARAEAGRRHRHTILYASFGAEEEGLVGSGVYVRDPTWPLDHTLAIINFDMVGRRFFELAVDRDAAIGAVGLDDDPALGGAAREAAKDAGLALVETSPALLYAVGEAFRGDDWNFRSPSLPSLHFSTGLHDDYHRPTDTPDKLSSAQLVRTARLVRGIVTRLEGE
jgi:Iap family predicted aminopeptidase